MTTEDGLVDIAALVTPQSPTGREVGSLIGECLLDHVDGQPKRYRLTVTEWDGLSFSYYFGATDDNPDGRVRLLSVVYHGTHADGLPAGGVN
jgi:hypothetical protein